jgi:hypothetical protein
MRARRVLAVLVAAAAATLFGVSPAMAAGSYTSTHQCTNGMGVQGHYLIYSTGALTRADGMAGYTGPTGALTRVIITELSDGVERGRRDISYDPRAGAKSVSILDTPTTYLPWMPRQGGHRETTAVSIYSTGGSCGYAWTID